MTPRRIGGSVAGRVGADSSDREPRRRPPASVGRSPAARVAVCVPAAPARGRRQHRGWARVPQARPGGRLGIVDDLGSLPARRAPHLRVRNRLADRRRRRGRARGEPRGPAPPSCVVAVGSFGTLGGPQAEWVGPGGDAAGHCSLRRHTSNRAPGAWSAPTRRWGPAVGRTSDAGGVRSPRCWRWCPGSRKVGGRVHFERVGAVARWGRAHVGSTLRRIGCPHVRVAVGRWRRSRSLRRREREVSL
ncbi:hypothetical protein BH10ACT1_BH10ACT1_40470 [soil metagenome]